MSWQSIDISVCTKVVDQPTIIATPKVMPQAWLKSIFWWSFKAWLGMDTKTATSLSFVSQMECIPKDTGMVLLTM